MLLRIIFSLLGILCSVRPNWKSWDNIINVLYIVSINCIDVMPYIAIIYGCCICIFFKKSINIEYSLICIHLLYSRIINNYSFEIFGLIFLYNWMFIGWLVYNRHFVELKEMWINVVLLIMITIGCNDAIIGTISIVSVFYYRSIKKRLQILLQIHYLYGSSFMQHFVENMYIFQKLE